MSFSEAERLAIPPQYDYDRIELPESTNLTLRLENHGSVLDLPDEKQFSNDLKLYDGLLIEGVDDQNHDKTFSQIARGDYKAYSKFKSLCQTSYGDNEWLSGIASALFNTRIAVAGWDISTADKPFAGLRRGLPQMASTLRFARSEEDILKLKPAQIEYFGYQRDREQIVLEKFAPTIGFMASTHSLFDKTRQGRQVEVLAMYGTIHRSLADGLSHKKELDAADSFNVAVLDSSNPGFFEEELYARFVRGLEIPDDLLIKRMSVSMVCAGLIMGGYVSRDHTSSTEIDMLSSRIIKDKDFSKISEVYRNLSRGLYDLMISDDDSEPIELVEKNRSSPFIKP